MTTYCEIVEDFAEAVSSLVDTSIVTIALSSAIAISTALSGTTLTTFEESGNATSALDLYAAGVFTSSATAADSLFPTVRAHELPVSSGEARARAFLGLTIPTLASSGDGEASLVSLEVLYLFSSTANGSSTVLAANIASALSIDSALATDSYMLGQQVTSISSADAEDVLFATRRAQVFSVSTADVADTAFASNAPSIATFVEVGTGASSLVLQAEHNTVITSEAIAESSAWSRDPALVAWVLNTETTAGSWYDNFDYESIAQINGRTLAVGPDGLYELTGNTDDGNLITAEVRTGFVDFGTPFVKRVDMAYFGYTSAGTITLTAETQDSGHSPIQYRMEQRSASAPRNSRVTFDKGVWGRYWRFTIGNSAGADFELHDGIVDIAVSARRV